MTPLPKKLKKEPLIDAVFEIRFASDLPAAGILPGLLFGKLEGDNKRIEQLPVSQIPQQVRDADPNLQFAPLSRLDWGKFYVNIGDRSVSVGCKHPYPGWNKFKAAITEVTNNLGDANVIKTVERYSMKYVDLIPATTIRDQIASLNLAITLANHELKQEFFQLRIEIPSAHLIHAVQVVSSATVTLQTGESRAGLIVDVDSIALLNSISFGELTADLSEKLESIHLENKKTFFDCLKEDTLVALEPEYE